MIRLLTVDERKHKEAARYMYMTLDDKTNDSKMRRNTRKQPGAGMGMCVTQGSQVHVWECVLYSFCLGDCL